MFKKMLVSTTPSLEGFKVTEYLNVVTGEVIVGANLFRDLFANIRDMVGGRSGAYENVLERARTEAMAEIQERAADMGANAVIGIHLDYEVVGQSGSMLMVSATGTAVKVERA